VVLPKLGERTIWIDCDVIQADGGTRTAAITGGFVALVDALRWLWHEGKLMCIPVAHFVAAVSSGIVDGRLMLDLCFEEDSKASVDFNVVMNEVLQFIEIQGTAEEGAFVSDDLYSMLDLARRGIEELIKIQEKSLQLSSEEWKAVEIAGSLRQQQ
jgi:ribonuclease PH